MKLLLDENLPKPLRSNLASKYPGSIDVADSPLKSKSDQHLYKYAAINRLTIVSMDLGFANIVQYPPEKLMGIIVIRPKGLRIIDVCQIVPRFLTTTPQNELEGSLIVITKQSVRRKGK